MTLLARSVIGFLVESLTWVAVVVAGGAAISAPLWWGERSRAAAAQPTLWAAFGAVVGASVGDRLEGPYGLLVHIGRRPLPAAWAAAGAAVGAIALFIVRRRHQSSPA